MAALLVSVRSAAEALAALAGGAAVIDVKEPSRGPLGRADGDVWRAVLAAVSQAGAAPAHAWAQLALIPTLSRGEREPEIHPLAPIEQGPEIYPLSPRERAGVRGFRDRGPAPIPVSVALGELGDWRDDCPPCPADFAGLAFRKLGLAHAGPGWADDWARLRRSLGHGPPWVAVIYADGPAAGAPHPDDVLDVALAAPECAGVLVDTWDKSRPSPLDLSWAPRVRRAQAGGRFVALAGGLDEPAIARLAPLAPDLFAVRGAACGLGDRRGTIDPARVARLARAAGRDEFAKIGPSRRPGAPLS